MLERRQNKWLHQTQHFYCSPATSKSSKFPLILPCFYHKSATTCQIDSNKVSNSKLKHDLCSCVKSEII